MFWTVLMAEVVGEVEASLFLSLMMVLGLEECLSLVQLGLLVMSDSQEQLGEQGVSYLEHDTHTVTSHTSRISYPAFSPARLRAVSLSEVVSAAPSMLSSLKG